MSATDDILPVSLVIPTYNGERYIEEALHSVFAQTQLPSEVIVVDDASTDSTARRVEEVAATAPLPVKLIRLSQNSGGPVQPMNVGIESAQSPLIAVLDQDDVFLPQRIESQSKVLSTRPEVAFVFGLIDVKQELDATPVSLPEKQWNRLRKQMVSEGDLTSCEGSVALRVLLNYGNCVGGFPGFTFRRDDWRAIGGLDERLVAAADHDLLCRLCERGRVAVVPELHYLHRLHDANLSRRRVNGFTDEIETLAKYADCNEWPKAAQEVRQTIDRALYKLSIFLGGSGCQTVSLRLLAASLLVAGIRPPSLMRAANYPLKVLRRRRRSCHAPTADEMDRVDRILGLVFRLYGNQAWRLWLKSVRDVGVEGDNEPHQRIEKRCAA